MITHRVKDALILAAVVTFLVVGIAEATYSANFRPVRLHPFLLTHHHTAAPQMTLNRSVAAVGGTVEATGSHFVPGDTVALRLDSASGALLASTTVVSGGSGGGFTLGFPVPATAALGPHTVHAVVFGNTVASAPLTVALLVRTDPHPAVVALGGSTVDVRIMIDAGAQHLDAAEVRLGFDPARLQSVDTDGNSANGVQLIPGVFDQALINRVENAAGVIAFAGGRSVGQPAPSGAILLATVRLRGLALGAWPLTVVSSELAFNSGIVPSVGADGVVQVVGNRLVFTAQPLRTAAGADFGLQPAVALVDASGAVLTGDSSTVVTLSLAPGSGPSSAALTCAGGLIKSLSAGRAAFTGCQVTPPGAGYRLTATGAPAGAPLTAPFNATLAGDTDGGDCRVSAVDFSLVVTHFNKNAAHTDWTGAAQAFRSDLNGDGRTSVLDFSMLVSNFGRTVIGCAPPGDLPTMGIQSFAFLPATLTVPVGSTVIWINFDAASHTVTADSGLWNSGQLATGKSFAYTFATPGTYTYFCALHPSMRGTITVLEAPATGGGGGSGGGGGGGGGSAPPAVATAAETQHEHDAP